MKEIFTILTIEEINFVSGASGGNKTEYVIPPKEGREVNFEYTSDPKHSQSCSGGQCDIAGQADVTVQVGRNVHAGPFVQHHNERIHGAGIRIAWRF